MAKVGSRRLVSSVDEVAQPPTHTEVAASRTAASAAVEKIPLLCDMAALYQDTLDAHGVFWSVYANALVIGLHHGDFGAHP